MYGEKHHTPEQYGNRVWRSRDGGGTYPRKHTEVIRSTESRRTAHKERIGTDKAAQVYLSK